MWCPSVRLSVRPSRSWILSKRINIKLYSNFFSPSGSHTIHFFRTKRHGNIPTGTFLTGASNAGGVCRNRDNEPISGFIACCQCSDRLVVTLRHDSKRRSLLMAGDDDEMFMIRSLNVTPTITERHLIVRSGKSVACVTGNKRLRSTFWSCLLTDTKHRASSLRQRSYLFRFW